MDEEHGLTAEELRRAGLAGAAGTRLRWPRRERLFGGFPRFLGPPWPRLGKTVLVAILIVLFAGIVLWFGADRRRSFTRALGLLLLAGGGVCLLFAVFGPPGGRWAVGSRVFPDPVAALGGGAVVAWLLLYRIDPGRCRPFPDAARPCSSPRCWP